MVGAGFPVASPWAGLTRPTNFASAKRKLDGRLKAGDGEQLKADRITHLYLPPQQPRPQQRPDGGHGDNPQRVPDGNEGR